MLNYSYKGVTASTVRDTRKKKTTDDCPIRIRVTHKRKQLYYSTGISLSEADWERLPETKSPRLIKVRNDITKVFNNTAAHIDELVYTEAFSFTNLNYRMGNSGGDTVNTAFKLKIEKLLKADKISTADWYKYTLRSLALYKGDTIEFESVTIDWLKKYEKHLSDEGKSYTTISMYMRALQVIMNDAKTLGIVKLVNHPFGKGKYEIPQHEGRKMALTISQIGQIVKFECHTQSLAMCRDVWFFSYLCNGANVTDICKLRYSNISNGEFGFYRQKTIAKSKVKRQVRAVITPEMQRIMERWGNEKGSQDTLIFPFLAGNESAVDERRIIKNVTHLINDNMQKIGKKLGIENISTYTARHSFATVLKRSGANIAYISESLGHNDIKTTENYLDQFETEERHKNAMALTNFD